MFSRASLFRHGSWLASLALVCLASSAWAEPNPANRFIDLGDQAMEKGDFDKAVADYTEALDHGGSHPPESEVCLGDE